MGASSILHLSLGKIDLDMVLVVVEVAVAAEAADE